MRRLRAIITSVNLKSVVNQNVSLTPIETHGFLFKKQGEGKCELSHGLVVRFFWGVHYDFLKSLTFGIFDFCNFFGG